MKIQALGLLTAVGALVVASAGALTSCSQPPIECTAGHGDFAVRYNFVSGDAACNVKLPEHVGFQVYNPLTNQDNCEQRVDDLICEDTEADATKVIIGMQAEGIGNYLFAEVPDDDTTHKAYSVGNVTNVLPDADGFCYVPTMNTAQQHIPLVPGEGGGMPAPIQEETDVTYAWSNVKIYVTADAPGTQFTADLTYTENGCTATFKAVGMYPAIDCSADDDTTPEFETDPTLCNPNPDPAQGRVFGSGINPDFPTRCEESAGFALCVLDRDEIPALK